MALLLILIKPIFRIPILSLRQDLNLWHRFFRSQKPRQKGEYIFFKPISNLNVPLKNVKNVWYTLKYAPWHIFGYIYDVAGPLRTHNIRNFYLSKVCGELSLLCQCTNFEAQKLDLWGREYVPKYAVKHILMRTLHFSCFWEAHKFFKLVFKKIVPLFVDVLEMDKNHLKNDQPVSESKLVL